MSEKPICHMNLARDYRGGERQTELLIRELARRGCKQRLVVRRDHTLLERCADIESLELVTTASNPVSAGLAARGSRIVHAHDARTVYSGLTANVFFGIPYLLTRRVVAPQKPSWIRRLAYRRAASVVAIAPVVAERIRAAYPDVEVPVVADAIASFECDEDEIRAIRGRFAGKTLIGHVGALYDSHKGQTTIIEAARQSADRFPDWHFLICGSGGDESRYRELIGDLENVTLAGWVDNVGDYLSAFDVFLYPSRHEALGSVLLDAMQFGLPIVASNVDGIPDVVENGSNGYLISPDAPGEILLAIEGLLSDPDALAAIADRNRAKARSFSAARMADAYQHLYEVTA